MRQSFYKSSDAGSSNGFTSAIASNSFKNLKKSQSVNKMGVESTSVAPYLARNSISNPKKMIAAKTKAWVNESNTRHENVGTGKNKLSYNESISTSPKKNPIMEASRTKFWDSGELLRLRNKQSGEQTKKRSDGSSGGHS